MKRLWIAAALLFAGAAHAGPNLIVNGSFEQGIAGLGSFTGWTTALGDDGTFVDSNGQTGMHFGQATSGLWSAFFGSTQADGGATISQTIQTVAGETFVVAFDLANDNGGGPAANEFSVALNGASLFSATALAAQDYTRRTVSFVGTGAPALIAFGGFNDNGYAELDNVVVSAVPEPASGALVAIGALAVLASTRRRRRNR